MGANPRAAQDCAPFCLTRRFLTCYKGADVSNLYPHARIHGAFIIFPNDRKGLIVNKSELIEAIAQEADISKAAATKALDGLMNAVTKALKEGDTVTLVGFGTFYVGERAERQGRNPQTGAPLTIAAAKTPKFRAGKALKDAL